jgi:hypothetical protein
MQQLSLGDYRGNRDTLEAALGQQYSPLQGVQGMAQGMAQQGLSGVSRRLSMRQGEADLLARTLAIKDFEAQMLSDANSQKGEQDMADASEMLGGREAAMMDWANNVLQSYDPNSPEFKQAKRTIDMLSNRKRGGLAADKGYLDYIEEYDINNPISQGTLGSLAVQYRGGDPKNQKTRKYPKRNGPDNEYDDDGDEGDGE